MAIAVGLMMIQADPVIIAQVIQLVTDSRQQAPAHNHCTDALDIWLPLNFIAVQASPENANIKAGIMRNENA